MGLLERGAGVGSGVSNILNKLLEVHFEFPFILIQ